ncbi:inner membrane-spanning protein YciB [Pontibaca methylaminivorans]|uniref:Inner membrane-spanning protein YciB n=1 Tax=Pontibaca methylaminivorans TaxID=515897 RepID=A0A1R3WHJ8_9RHOB|nr:septation protein IspZ [Pontibaca methylaminivorans]SIT77609.1 intracellular septation protein [Pontibaca methylaminivorans]
MTQGDGSEERPGKISPVLKQVLELGPPLLFFVLYIWLRDESYVFAGTEYSGFIVATVAFIPILLLAMALLWRLSGTLSRMQILTAVLVVVFGGLTAWLNDERFFKMKTTIVFGLMALLLGIGLLRGQSWLAYVMAEALPMRREGWMILTRRLCLVFALLAVGNEVLWRSVSTDLWVKVETFGFPLILFVFLWWQIMALQPYMIESGDDT